jgi:methylated-DNA-protein-cysteine methyltransferase related protein
MGDSSHLNERDRRIIDVIRALADGEVSTYGDLAEVAGYPGLSRRVGALLADPPDPDLPWWRVVNATGRLVPGAEAEQTMLLRSEGVVVRDGRVRSAPQGRFRSR